MRNNVISINRNNSNFEHKKFISGTLVDIRELAEKGYNMPAEEFEAWKKKIRATKARHEAEKITVEIAAACRKYNDLNADQRLRGIYTLHIGGTLSKKARSV